MKMTVPGRPVMNDELFSLLNIVIPLLTGFVIYSIYRPDTYISNIIYVNMSFILDFAEYPVFLQKFFRFYLCDILWAYSLTFAVQIIISLKGRYLIILFAVCSLFEIAIEAFQYFGFLNGTFDPLDIILEIFASLTAITIIYKKQKGENCHAEKNLK